MQTGGIYPSISGSTSRIRTILSLALPMTAGMLSQSLVNLVDTAMVGHLGDQALAAVAIANYAIFVCFAMISGISVAVQSSVARKCGANHWQSVMVPVSKGIYAAFAVGLPLTLLLFAGSPVIIKLFHTTPEIAALAESYFRLRILSLPAGILLLTYRGFWNGCHSPSIYLQTLICIHLLNAVVSYALIFGVGVMIPAMGVDGAAIGTVIAMYGGVLANTVRMVLFSKDNHIPLRPPAPSRAAPFYRRAWPDSLQQTLFALGAAVLFWVIAQVGTNATVISHVLINISLLLILPGIGLGMAATTLINQAIGAGQQERAYRWGLEVVGCAALVLGTLSLPLVLFPEEILTLFVPDNTVLVAMGAVPLQLAGVGIILESAALVLTQALLGTGSNRTILHIRITTLWLLCLPITAIGVYWLDFSMVDIWNIQILQRVAASLLCLKVWQNRRWLEH